MSRARDRADGDFAGKELIFDADGDTSITADTDDQIDIRVAGSDQIKIAAGEVAFNEASGDIDFRVESNGNANIFVVDGGNDRVGIGGSPAFATEIQTSSTDTSLTAIGASQLVVTNTGTATTNQSAKVALRLADGSLNGNSFIAGVRESNSSRAMAMVFATAQTSDGDPDERVRVASGGDVTLTGGNLVIGTAGKGIDFSNATDVASGESVASSLLDDYEEGTFTPVFQGNSGSAGSYATSSASGRYTKIGDTIRVAIYLVVTNYGSWSGVAQVTGLPFTGNGAGSLGISVSYFPADTRQAPVSAYLGGNLIMFPKAHNAQQGGLTEKWQVSDLLTSKYIMAEGVYSV